MRPSPPNGEARARSRARGGIAPALLLDIQTPAGDVYWFADRAVTGIPAAIVDTRQPLGYSGDAMTTAPYAAPFGETAATYLPWLVATGSFSFNRSLQTDTGSMSLQNISGDVLQRDFQRIARRGVLEGSLYVFRYYAVDMEWAWIEQHGTLTVGDADITAPLSLAQLLAGSDDTPNQEYTETCQLNWGAGRCPATGNVECLYTYASCQVTERFTGIQTAFETNNPEAAANPPLLVINRKKAW